MSIQQQAGTETLAPDHRHGLRLAQSPEDLYAELVRDRIEERSKRVDRDVASRARYLADAYGAEDATPREVVELHLSVVTGLTRSAGDRRIAAIVASSQLVLIEVLGGLAAHYRNRASVLDGA